MDVSDQKTAVDLPVPLLAYLLGRMIDDTTLIESIVDTEIVALRLCHEIRRLLHKTWVQRVKATKDTKVRLLSRFLFFLFLHTRSSFQYWRDVASSYGTHNISAMTARARIIDLSFR